MSLQQEIKEIQERNRRVEREKAWETSWMRALSIALFTYGIAGVWLAVLHDTSPWQKALIPSMGFLLSTATLPIVKRWWIKKYIPIRKNL